MSEQPKVVVCFGDSNTHGTVPMADLEDSRRFGPDERWTGILAADLGPAWRVVEEGLPGRTTVHPDPIEGVHLSGLAALPIVIGSHSPIDAIVLMLGTNDLKARFSVGPSDIAASLEVLVRTIRTLSACPGRIVPQVLLVAPPPILEVGCLADMFMGGRAKSMALGTMLKRSAERLGIGFADAGEHIRSSERDGIHFDVDQHRLLAGAIGAALRDLPELNVSRL
jgi:lysophospholipase L1-like esterase